MRCYLCPLASVNSGENTVRYSDINEVGEVDCNTCNSDRIISHCKQRTREGLGRRLSTKRVISPVVSGSSTLWRFR